MAPKTDRLDPRQVAEIVAIRALEFLSREPEQLGLFLAETGLGPASLRSAANSPEFLTGVLEFILRDEKRVRAFAEASEFGPETITSAHIALSGQPWERETP